MICGALLALDLSISQPNSQILALDWLEEVREVVWLLESVFLRSGQQKTLLKGGEGVYIPRPTKLAITALFSTTRNFRVGNRVHPVAIRPEVPITQNFRVKLGTSKCQKKLENPHSEDNPEVPTNPKLSG